jgi:hypothetical protein
MIANWEERLRQAVLRDPSLSLSQRFGAGLVVVHTRASAAGRKWKRRAAVGTVALTVAAAAGFARLIGLL